MPGARRRPLKLVHSKSERASSYPILASSYPILASCAVLGARSGAEVCTGILVAWFLSVPRCFEVLPGTARTCHELPGGARSSQEASQIASF